MAYQLRGDRCEGLFAQRVSATGLRIVAFHEEPPEFDDTSLVLNIRLDGGPIPKSISITSTRPKQFYRLDTVVKGELYSMPLDIINHPDVGVAPSDFAMIICRQDCDNLVPTLESASFSDSSEANPYVVLVADLELFELRISLKDGDTGESLFDQEMLGNRTWPAARPAVFPLKPFFEEHETILFEVISIGRGNELIDSMSARLVRP